MRTRQGDLGSKRFNGSFDSRKNEFLENFQSLTQACQTQTKRTPKKPISKRLRFCRTELLILFDYSLLFPLAFPAADPRIGNYRGNSKWRQFENFVALLDGFWKTFWKLKKYWRIFHFEVIFFLISILISRWTHTILKLFQNFCFLSSKTKRKYLT